jgi:nucleotide-binding universal stress UspA family protein
MADTKEASVSTDVSSSGNGGQRKVIVAVDRSQQAEQALDWYLNTVHRPEYVVILIHVPEGPTLRGAEGQRLSDGEIQKLLEAEKKENEEMTKKYSTVLEKHGAKGNYRVVYNAKPGEAVVESALTEHADMIVMGTRGMGTIRRTVMGSVSDYVVHHSKVPVIVCRH